jgi:tRNA threonylcarbamoyl adenosine modification protein (Sua5/YciO/YrdC/YwlC family)
LTTTLIIHPQNPQPRLITQAAQTLENEGVIVYPTDSDYALGCKIGNTNGIERIRHIRQLSKDHNFTLLCRDLSEISTYARIDSPIFRYLKAHTPGPYTFILQATREVPKRLQHPKRRTIGIRVPENKIVQALLSELQQPLMSVTLILPDEEYPLSDIDTLKEKMQGRVDLIIDGGPCSLKSTTVVDLTSGIPEIIREGRGEIRG